MAIPPDNLAEPAQMLEVQQANSIPLTESLGEGSTSEIISYSNRPQDTSNRPQNTLFSSSPVLITAPAQDEYASRSSRESVLQRLSEALLRRSLMKIDLSQRGLQPSDARLVKMALSQNANLTVLKLGYNNLGDSGVKTLAGGIAVHRSLVLLDLGFNNFGDEGAMPLATAMQQASNRFDGGTLKTLYLAGNMIGEDGAFAMADFIRQGSQLSKLYMTGNRIGAEGVKAITEAILEHEIRRHGEAMLMAAENENPVAEDAEKTRIRSFSGMQELFLGGTGMGTLGCHAVARLLEKTSYLRVISFPNCDIGDEEVGILASSIKANKASLPIECIQLSFNDMRHKGLESLTNAVWGSTTLKELRIDNNNIGDRGAHQVAAILPALKALEVLDVGFNSIKATGLNVLMKAVAESQQLQSLSVSGNAIDVPAAKAVAYALAYNQSLRSLYLVHCNINHEGQRHISAGIVSNSNIALRKLTGFRVGPAIVTLGFPEAIQHWTNGQVLNFIHLMWDESDEANGAELDRELDPLNFLASPDGEKDTTNRTGPLEATIVVEVAKKAYESLVANGVDVFSRRGVNTSDHSFDSPLAGDAIVTESLSRGSNFGSHKTVDNPESDNLTTGDMPAKQARSFVAPPEPASNGRKQDIPDPQRKQRIVEWLCSNIQHLNEISQYPFDSRELWRLHQHYFTPVVNESGGEVAHCGASEARIVSSVPEVSRGDPGGSLVTPSTQSSDGHFSVPVSDPAFSGSPSGPNSLPLLKRKVSYRVLGEAMLNAHSKFEHRLESHLQNGSVARMIEEGHTGHSMPPKTKRARRNRSRISFVPRIKARLDSYLDVCHEKALITMRQLYFVERAILECKVHPLDSSDRRSHLSGDLAAEAEMIIVDMI
eukprot:scaffold24618_cov127-Cylindrotheca_fusiformis.AAC.9